LTSESALPVVDLAERCAEEMARYRRRQEYDPRFCYELFRRALVQRHEGAWGALYGQYHRLVHRWLGNVPGDSDDLVNQAFERFWRALAPDRFDDFATLGDLLEYLRRCAQSIAIDARRREERQRVEQQALIQMHKAGAVHNRDLLAGRILDAIAGEQLYAQVLKCLNDPQERLVFRASFEWDLKPGTIAGRWPNLFSSAQEVSRIKERIFRRLQRDAELKASLEIRDENGGRT